MTRGWIASALAAALGLTGCADVPRPFKPGDGKETPLTEIPTDARGVAVLPVAGLADLNHGDALAGAMVAALQAQDLPASLHSVRSRMSHTLSGRVQLESAGGRRGFVDSRLTIRWDLIDANAAPVGGFEQSVSVDAPTFGRADPDLLSNLAAKAAPKIASMLRPRPAPVAPSVAAQQPVLAVLPATGASGDGNTALPLAMKARLRTREVLLSAKQAEADYMLASRVEIGPLRADQRALKVEWRLRRDTGELVGRLSQENPVPATAISDRWGPLAQVIAEAAAPDVLRLISEDAAAPDRPIPPPLPPPNPLRGREALERVRFKDRSPPGTIRALTSRPHPHMRSGDWRLPQAAKHGLDGAPE